MKRNGDRKSDVSMNSRSSGNRAPLKRKMDSEPDVSMKSRSSGSKSSGARAQKTPALPALPDDVMDHVLAQTGGHCDKLPKWCQITQCDEKVWERACKQRNWHTSKPPGTTWQQWFKDRCTKKPEQEGLRLSRSLRSRPPESYFELMADAKKHGRDSFMYKERRHIRQQRAGNRVVYLPQLA